jgi:UDP-glucose 4-epimerase
LKILIVGSEGFIGSHCVTHFSSISNFVHGIDLFERPSHPYSYTKISRLSPELEELFASQQFDAVINAAGSGSVPYSMSHPVLDFEANSLDTILVLDAIRKHQPSCKYLHLSSAAVYGNPVRLPVKESDAVQPLSSYGWHKLIAENLCKEYSAVFGLNTAVARPFSVYGPGLKKQLFWDVYQKQKNVHPTIALLGTGKESRDYIYVEDLIHALDCILLRGEMRGEVYNVASGYETTIGEAVSLFLLALNSKKTMLFDGTMRVGDPLNWLADISKLQQLDFKAKIDLKEGIIELAEWITSVKD